MADELADLPLWERHLVAKNSNFRFLLLEFILPDQLAYLPPLEASSGKYGNFRFLLVEFILADQLAYLPPWERHLVAKMVILDFYYECSYWQINWQIYSI